MTNKKESVIIGKTIKKKKKRKSVKEELSDLVINIEEVKDNKVVFYFNKVLKPYERNRSSYFGGNHLYDPLNSYKNFIKNRIKLEINNYNLNNKNKFNIINENCEIMIDTIIYKVPPKKFSQIKKILCVRGEIKPISNPDNDNFEKTIFDIFNKIIWYDDKQVVDNSMKKRYYFENGTRVTITWKEQIEPKGRLDKEFKETLTEKEINFLKK